VSSRDQNELNWIERNLDLCLVWCACEAFCFFLFGFVIRVDWLVFCKFWSLGGFALDDVSQPI
jgi:hypothetical protein